MAQDGSKLHVIPDTNVVVRAALFDRVARKYLYDNIDGVYVFRDVWREIGMVLLDKYPDKESEALMVLSEMGMDERIFPDPDITDEGDKTAIMRMYDRMRDDPDSTQSGEWIRAKGTQLSNAMAGRFGPGAAGLAFAPDRMSPDQRRWAVMQLHTKYGEMDFRIMRMALSHAREYGQSVLLTDDADMHVVKSDLARRFGGILLIVGAHDRRRSHPRRGRGPGRTGPKGRIYRASIQRPAVSGPREPAKLGRPAPLQKDIKTASPWITRASI